LGEALERLPQRPLRVSGGDNPHTNGSPKAYHMCDTAQKLRRTYLIMAINVPAVIASKVGLTSQRRSAGVPVPAIISRLPRGMIKGEAGLD
jgi:hypothetical protein